MYYSIALVITLVCATISTVGGAVYLIWNLSLAGMILTLVLSAVALFFILRFVFSKSSRELKLNEIPHTKSDLFSAEAIKKIWTWGLIPFGILIGICITLLVRSQIGNSINTPWKVVPPLFWLALTFATLGGTTLLLRAKNNISWIVSLGLVGVGVSIAVLVYRLGYGYDPFVHQAAEQHILDYGFIAPKTPYYAGAYALTTIISVLTKIPIHFVDVWLLPILTTIGITGAIGFNARENKQNTGWLTAGLLAVLPLAPFINTTPFGLAAFYCLISATIGLGVKNNPRLKLLVWIFALAATITHPIAGIPAIVLASIIQFEKLYVQIFSATVGITILPILFAISGNGFSFSWDRLKTIGLPFEMALTRFRAFGDPLYAIGTIVGMIIFISILTKTKYLFATISAILSGLAIAVFIDFSYLPDSEQGGYAARLLIVAMLIGAPAAAEKIALLFNETTKRSWQMLTAICGITFLFVGGIYLAYPREDAYVISKGWNTSETDVSVVHAIAADAKGEPYIVLAAQPVSAAALKEFGFFRYFDTKDGQIFAYPVPTGGALYQHYLKMIYDEPSSEHMKQAMELAGVKLGYFVVNSYWTRADHIISRAQQTSEKWFGIDKADYVFRYRR